MSNKGRTPDEKELGLWNRFVSGIKPIVGTNKKDQDAPETLKSKVIKEPRVRNNNIAFTPQSTPISPKTNELDGHIRKKMRKGTMQVDAILDLHDKNQDQAYQALVGFVTRAFQSNNRCVLVITGKGTRSKAETGFWSSKKDGVGILKSRLPEWVATPPLNDMVLRAQLAHKNHGGDGAFYLYLKNKHKT